MESPEKLDKGKGKAAAIGQDPMDDEEGSSEEDEEVKHPQPQINRPIANYWQAENEGDGKQGLHLAH